MCRWCRLAADAAPRPSGQLSRRDLLRSAAAAAFVPLIASPAYVPLRAWTGWQAAPWLLAPMDEAQREVI